MGLAVCGCLQDISEVSAITVPTLIFVFLDMREDRVNWSNFMTDMTGYSPPDPSQYNLPLTSPGCITIWPPAFRLPTATPK